MADNMGAIFRGQRVPQEATRSIQPQDVPTGAPFAPTPAATVGSSAPFEQANRLQLIDFVVDQPLASLYPIPSNISRVVMDADHDIAKGRLESALDLTLFALTEQPDCIGLSVRQAGLLLATGRQDSARLIVAAVVEANKSLDDPGVLVEVERIQTHAHPSDEQIIKLAHTVLAARRLDLIDLYLPIAIETALLQRDATIAGDLARRWLEIRPDNLDAAFAFTKESLRLGQMDDATRIASTLPESHVDPRGLVIRLVIATDQNSPVQWDIAATIQRGIESKQIALETVQALLQEMIVVQPANESLVVHRGVLEINTGSPGIGQQLLSAVRLSDPHTNFVATVARARGALAAGNFALASEAVRRAMQLYGNPEIVQFAAECPILRSPHDLFSIGKSVAGALQQDGDASEAVRLLDRLVSLAPGRLDLSRSHADALARSGKREVAITRLEEMLHQHEQAGNFEEIQLTIQAILQISPGNLRLRGRLINDFMKRGMLQEAVQERWTQAQILERAGRIDDAVEQLRRASDVTSVLADWKRLESILRRMVQMCPDDMDVRHFAATKFIEFGQIEKAIEQLWGVVNISTRQNNPDDTIAALHQIIALGPREVDAYHRLGEVLASVGEYAQAERVYRRLLTLVPDDPAIQAKQSALAVMAKSG